MNCEKIDLCRIAQVKNGFAFKSNEYTNNGLRVIRITNVQKGKIVDSNPQFIKATRAAEFKEYLLSSGDILISLTGNVGRVGILTKDLEPAVLNQRVACIRVINKDVINSEYLFQYLNSEMFEKECINNSNGIAQLNLSSKWVENYQIPIPSIDNQIRIAAILTRAKKLITNRLQTIKVLDEFIKSVFVEMFGDPVKNEKGWERVTIADLVNEVKYGTSKSAEGGRYKYLRMNNITNEGYWNFSNLKYIEIEDSEKEKYVLRKNDLVFNRTNSKDLVGKTAVYCNDEEVIIAGYLIRVRTKHNVNPWYIWGYLNSRAGKQRLYNLCRNIVGMANINAQELQAIPILKPPYPLQNQFAAIIEQIELIKSRYIENVTELENLYGSLSQRAFRGDLNLNKIPANETKQATESFEDEPIVLAMEDEQPIIKEYSENELVKIIHSIGESFNFDQLMTKIENAIFKEMPKYEVVKNQIFNLLKGTNPLVIQTFDKDRKEIVLRANE